jgi:uncharacterized delta-60 repeat protein
LPLALASAHHGSMQGARWIWFVPFAIACGPSMDVDAGSGRDADVDASEIDGGMHDAGMHDAGIHDAGMHDAGMHDAGIHDGGMGDGGRPLLPPVVPGADPTFGAGGAAIIGMADVSAMDPSQVLETDDGILVAAPGRESIGLGHVLADGTLDPSFGRDGVVSLPIGMPVGGVPGVSCPPCSLHAAIAPDDRIVIGTSVRAVFGFDRSAVVRTMPDGSLDASFGEGGVASRFDERTGGVWTLNDVVVDASSRVLVALDDRITRLAVDGSLDAGFGAGGHFSSSLGGRFAEYEALAIQPDGYIVATGLRYMDAGPTQVFLVRLTPGGVLDPSFGAGGVVLDPVGPNNGVSAGHVLIESDGHIVIAGSRRGTSGSHFALARFDSTGVMDTSFGTSGWAYTSAESASLTLSPTVSSQSDGRLVAFARMQNGAFRASFARFSIAGALDTTFGVAGAGELPATAFPLVLHGTVLSDDRVVVSGRLVIGGVAQAAVFRTTASGRVDTTFGGDGQVEVPLIPGLATGARAAAVQSDGRVLIGGTTGVTQRLQLARLTAGGALDPTFGAGGVVSGGGVRTAHALAVDGAGNVYVVGLSGAQLDVARFAANGVEDESFTLDRVPGGAFRAGGVFAAPDGDVYLAGSVTLDASGEEWLGVVRVREDGTPDPGFGDGGVALVDAPSTVGNVRLAVWPSGDLLAVGGGVLARVSSDGDIVASFGAGAPVFGDGEAVAIDPSGGVVLADVRFGSTSETEVRMTRYRADGSIDGTFVLTQRLGQRDHPWATAIHGIGLMVRDDGMIRLATALGTTDRRLLRGAIYQYTAAGAPDATFGAGGRLDLTTPGDSSFHDLVALPDGASLIVGRAWSEEHAASSMLALRMLD